MLQDQKLLTTFCECAATVDKQNWVEAYKVGLELRELMIPQGQDLMLRAEGVALVVVDTDIALAILESLRREKSLESQNKKLKSLVEKLKTKIGTEEDVIMPDEEELPAIPKFNPSNYCSLDLPIETETEGVTAMEQEGTSKPIETFTAKPFRTDEPFKFDVPEGCLVFESPFKKTSSIPNSPRELFVFSAGEDAPPKPTPSPFSSVPSIQNNPKRRRKRWKDTKMKSCVPRD